MRLGRVEQRYDTGTWRARGDAFTLTGLGRKTHGRDSETAYMRKTGVR